MGNNIKILGNRSDFSLNIKLNYDVKSKNDCKRLLFLLYYKKTVVVREIR